MQQGKGAPGYDRETGGPWDQWPRSPPETIESCWAASDRKSPTSKRRRDGRVSEKVQWLGRGQRSKPVRPSTFGLNRWINGVGKPDETLRAITTIRMIRGYGKNVAANLNKPRFRADKAAPLHAGCRQRTAIQVGVKESPKWRYNYVSHGSLLEGIRQTREGIPATGSGRRPDVATVVRNILALQEIGTASKISTKINENSLWLSSTLLYRFFVWTVQVFLRTFILLLSLAHAQLRTLAAEAHRVYSSHNINIYKL